MAAPAPFKLDDFKKRMDGALNALTQLFAHELRGENVLVNAVCPGWVKTEMGGAGATMELPDGAKTSVALATIGGDGPNGAYVHLGETLPW
jgi:NAD(P)-dependent dehydrogenase (short-subunit alcohol dehydrogenase family)